MPTHARIAITTSMLCTLSLAIWLHTAQAADQLTSNLADDCSPAWSPDGSRVALGSNRSGNWDVWAVPSAGGNPVAITTGTQADEQLRPAWSPDGNELAFVTVQDQNWDIWILSLASGELFQLTPNHAPDLFPSWSPDGSKIAFTSSRVCGLNYDIFIADRYTREVTRVTQHPADDVSPAWSPDGSQIAFSSRRGGNLDLYVISIYGGAIVQLTHDPADDSDPAWSPDGSRIAFSSTRGCPAGNRRIWVVPGAGGVPSLLVGDPNVDEGDPAWSPDGTCIAYESNRSGNYDIWTCGATTAVLDPRAGVSAPGHTMYPNSPNPFNPATTVRYDLAEPTAVRLRVFDVDGQLVRLLCDVAHQPPGMHMIRWDGRDDAGHPVASGVYYCRIDAGHWSKTQSMVLMK